MSIDVNVSGLGDVGLITDRPAHDMPPNAWSDLSNYRCKNGQIEPMDGYEAFTSISTTGSKEVYAHQLVSLVTETTVFLVFPFDADGDGDAEKIRVYNGATDSDITRSGGDYTGTTDDLWQVTPFNGLVVLNNGKDAPQYWTGSSVCQDTIYDGSSAWGAFDTDGAGGVNAYSARVIRAFGNYLFALNITEGGTNYPQMIHWSNPAEPGLMPDSWNYRSASNDANRTVLAETDGHVLDALPLGDQLMIYKEDAVYRCAFVAGQFIFDIDLVTTSHGLWSTNCVVDIGNRHVCLGDGVVYTHTGGDPQNILYGKNADRLFNSIDTTAYKSCFLAHNKPENEVWICYPESGEIWANHALIWNYANNAWYERDIPKCSTIKPGIVTENVLTAWSDYSGGTSWNDVSRTWNQRDYSPIGDTLIAASVQLNRFGSGVTTDSVVATRKDLVIGNADEWHMIKRMIPHASGSAFHVQVGRQEAIGAPVFWSSKKLFTPGTSHKLDFRETARVHALRISGNSGQYQVSGYKGVAEQVGQR